MVANIAMKGVVTLLEEIGVLVSLAVSNKKSGDNYYTSEQIDADRQLKEAITFIVKAARSLLEFTKSGHLEYAIDRLELWPSDKKKLWSDLFARACALREAIRIELKEHLFYAYPKEKGKKFTAWEEDWGKIHVAFPEIGIDTFCATDCYALGHNTASVFHSMRVAEAGLRALAKERHVKLPKNKLVDWATWGEIINALEGKAKLVRQSKAGPRKDAELEFYSGVLADLNGFKDEYRNLVMHSREHYDEFQAARALSRVHDFMARLAKSPRIKRGSHP
jgi:hypothetical protein